MKNLLDGRNKEMKDSYELYESFFVIILLESIEENIMAITLGVSVYPEQETIEQIDTYLKLASSYGFTKVFTSMFSIEGNKDEVAQYFKNFTGIAHQYGMKV